MSILLTIGTFDLTHVGHVLFLQRCERYAEKVIVGVNSDDFIKRYKGKAPVYPYEMRKMLVEKLGYEVRFNDGPGVYLIRMIKPDLVAIGTDWARKDYHAQIATPIEYFEEHGIGMLYLPYTLGISSSFIKEKMRA